MRRLLLLIAAIFGLPAQPVLAQSAASPYTSGARYDLSRRVVGTIAADPDGAGSIAYAAVRNSYNADGLLTKVEQGELAAWQSESVVPSAWTGFTVFRTIDYTYDLTGRKVKETLTAGGVVQSLTQTSYDGLNRPVCVAVRMNPAVFASPPADACALGTEGSAGPDRIAKTFYDAAGRVAKVQKGYGTSLSQDYVSYTYTGNGKQASVTDANATRAAFVYDGHDRLQRWFFASKVAANTASTTDYEEYGYDAASNRTTLRKRDGRSFTFTYDPMNRVASKVVPDACVGGYACTNVPAAATRDVFYGYDNRSLQAFVRFTGTSASNDGITNTYDNMGRLGSSAAKTGATTRTLTYAWDANSNRTTVTHPDSKTFTYLYDGLDRLKELKQGATSLATIAYDNQGRRQSQTRLAGVATTYGYDNASRLSSLTDDMVGTGQDLASTFTYNPASQVTVRTRSNDSFVPTETPGARSYAVNGLNQYSAVNGTGYGYDSNGNLTFDGSTNYSYDAENRLAGASGLLNASLAYDPLGRLAETSGASGANLTRYLYDGDELVAEYNNAGTVQRRYVHGAAVDDPLIWYEGLGTSAEARRHLFADHQGSVVSLADSSGNPIGINRYDEWGLPAAGNQGRFQYTGQAYIPELGLYHYKARAYSPVLGRFMQTDPVGYEGGDFNLYGYVGNDPVNKTDPSGLYQCGASAKKETEKGGSTGCQEFEKFRKEVEAYKRSLKRTMTAESRQELSRVNRILGAIGTLNDGNNVTVETEDLGADTPAKASMNEETGAITLRLDLNQIAERVAEGKSGGGVSTIHEGSHIVDFNDLGVARTKSECMSYESRAYATQNAMSKDRRTGVVNVEKASQDSCRSFK